MIQLITLFVLTLIMFLLVDFVWLGVIAKNIYMESLFPLIRKSNSVFAPNWAAGSVVYILMTLGIILFVLPRAQGDYLEAARWGAIFGLILYGVYDFTNLAILHDWPLVLSLLDITWGMILCTVVSMFATFVLKWLS